MSRVIVHSRSGNVVLAVLGAVYVLGAIAAFVAFAADVWSAASFTDRALGLGLIAAAIGGVWLLVTGLENLGVHFGRRLHLR